MSCLNYTAFGSLMLRKNDDDHRLKVARNRHDVDGWSGFANDVFVSLLDGDQRESSDPNTFSKKMFDTATSDLNWLSIQDSASVHPTIAAKATSRITGAVSNVMQEEITDEENDQAKSESADESADESAGLPTLPPTPDGDESAAGDGIDAMKAIALMEQTGALADELERDAERVAMLRGIGLLADVTTGEDPIDEDLIDAVAALDDFDDFVDMLGHGEEARGKGLTESHCNVVGVETDDDIGRLIPLELAKLRHPVLGLETKKRILQKDAFCWEYKDQDSAKGDFVLMVDRSSSMFGSPIRWARSLAINLIRGCVDDDRRVVLSIFAGDGDVDVVVVEDKATMASAIKNLLCPPRGGTDFDGALTATANNVLVDEGEDIDVLVITDCMLPSFERKEWMTGRLVCAAIGCGTSPGFDATVQIDNVDGAAMMRVVEELI